MTARVTSTGSEAPAARRRYRARPGAVALGAAALAASPDAIVIGRPGGRVLACNPAAERLFGWTQRDARELPFSGLFDRGAPAPEEAREGASPPPGRVAQACRADGGTFRAEVVFRPLRSGHRGAVAAYVREIADGASSGAVTSDVPRFSGAPTAAGSLLAGVAHELNNPLAILVAQATVLQDLAPDADVARRAERILTAAQRAGRIVKNLLAMTRQRPPVLEPVDLNGVLDEALGDLARALRDSGIAVRRDFAPGLPEARADRGLLAQAVANVVTNAQHALADRRGPRVILVRSSWDGAGLVVEIRDSGPGIPAGTAERIFEPYFTTRPSGTALGLGLSLSRSILADQGATIALDRSAGWGASFRIVLPPARDPIPTRERVTRAPAISVLVVDDAPDVAEALADLIGLLGHEVHVATSAVAALDAVKAKRFDLAFVDLRMPDVDGIELGHAFGALDQRLAARTVIVTGDAGFRPLPDESASQPPYPVLEKPFTAQRVKALIDRISPR